MSRTPEPNPGRYMPRSYRPYLVTLAFAAVVGWAVVSRVSRPDSPAAPDPPAADPNRVSWGREEAEAKKLPEYAELRVPPPKKGEARPPPTDEQVARFVALADHSNRWIQVLAVGRLAGVTGPRRDEAVGVIAAKLRDPEPLMRATAMGGLATAKATDRIPDLLPFLDSPHEEDGRPPGTP